MQSNNPVFRRSEEFNRAGGQYGTQQYGTQQYGQQYGQAGAQQGYADPSQWGTGTPGGPLGYDMQRSGATMSVDSVVQKTSITLGVVILAAFATWIVTPDITLSTNGIGMLYAALTVGSLGAFALSMVNSFKRVVSPALVLAFAAFEGVAMGALSKVFDAMFGGGIVVQAVIGTFAAFAGTLAAYKFFNIRVGNKFRTFMLGAMLGMVALGLMEMVLGLFGAQFGLFGFGALGLLFAVAGLVLGVFMLILDFDFVEQGIANGLPEVESWRASFAMTVSLVWIYTNLLRILAILQQD